MNNFSHQDIWLPVNQDLVHINHPHTLVLLHILILQVVRLLQVGHKELHR